MHGSACAAAGTAACTNVVYRATMRSSQSRTPANLVLELGEMKSCSCIPS